MTATYSTPETFAPAVAIFACRCGKHAAAYGTQTGSLPPGWVEAALERDEHFCPECARRYSEALARSK